MKTGGELVDLVAISLSRFQLSTRSVKNQTTFGDHAAKETEGGFPLSSHRGDNLLLLFFNSCVACILDPYQKCDAADYIPSSIHIITFNN